MLIGEYEATLNQKTKDRQDAEERAREANERYKRAKEKLEQDIVTGKNVYLSYLYSIVRSTNKVKR